MLTTSYLWNSSRNNYRARQEATSLSYSRINAHILHHRGAISFQTVSMKQIVLLVLYEVWKCSRSRWTAQYWCMILSVQQTLIWMLWWKCFCSKLDISNSVSLSIQNWQKSHVIYLQSWPPCINHKRYCTFIQSLTLHSDWRKCGIQTYWQLLLFVGGRWKEQPFRGQPGAWNGATREEQPDLDDVRKRVRIVSWSIPFLELKQSTDIM